MSITTVSLLMTSETNLCALVINTEIEIRLQEGWLAQRWGKDLLELFLKVSETRRTLSAFFLFGVREETVWLGAV